MASSENNKLELLKQLLESAEISLNSAKEILYELTGEELVAASSNMSKKPTNGFQNGQLFEESGTIVEGIFDGLNMIGPDGKKYPVPPNYASKSKLVSGDILKLTIASNGSFIYKQIGPVERIQVIGTLKQVGASFFVNTDEGDFQVLTASVTYFKAEPGDQITIIVPAGANSGWGAIENIIPKTVSVAGNGSNGKKMKKSSSAEPETFEMPKTLFKRSEE